jgi:hypothetical protein
MNLMERAAITWSSYLTMMNENAKQMESRITVPKSTTGPLWQAIKVIIALSRNMSQMCDNYCVRVLIFGKDSGLLMFGVVGTAAILCLHFIMRRQSPQTAFKALGVWILSTGH